MCMSWCMCCKQPRPRLLAADDVLELEVSSHCSFRSESSAQTFAVFQAVRPICRANPTPPPLSPGRVTDATNLHVQESEAASTPGVRVDNINTHNSHCPANCSVYWRCAHIHPSNKQQATTSGHRHAQRRLILATAVRASEPG